MTQEYVIVANAIIRIDADSEEEALLIAESEDSGNWEINDITGVDTS